MAQQIEIDNFSSANVIEQDRLDADAAAGTKQILTQNTANYQIGQYVCVGALGTETCEMAVVQSIDDATHITFVQGLVLKHERFEPLTPLNGSQIRIYRAPNVTGLLPDDTTFTMLTTIGISVSDMISLYTDSTGSNQYWYKYTYYNPTTTFETSLGDSTAARGGGYDYYTSAYSIRRTAGLLNNPYITDADIDEKRKEAQQEIDSALQGMYSVPFQPPIDPMIAGITRLLAAGKLMMDDPGGQGANSVIYQEGETKVTEARNMLDMIDQRKYFLTDTNGNPTISPNSQSSKSFPDQSTVYQGPGNAGSDRLWRISDADGYSTRRY